MVGWAGAPGVGRWVRAAPSGTEVLRRPIASYQGCRTCRTPTPGHRVEPAQSTSPSFPRSLSPSLPLPLAPSFPLAPSQSQSQSQPGVLSPPPPLTRAEVGGVGHCGHEDALARVRHRHQGVGQTLLRAGRQAGRQARPQGDWWDGAVRLVVAWVGGSSFQNPIIATAQQQPLASAAISTAAATAAAATSTASTASPARRLG